MSSTLPTPSDDTSCGWFHLSRYREPRPTLKKDVQARWTIIGAGLSGLANARRLAQHFPNDEILLIDAQVVGYGSSGCNSGFVIDLPHDIGAPDYIGDLNVAKKNLALNQMAKQLLDELISTHNIECDIRHTGKYQAAIEPSGLTILDSYSKGLEKLGEECEMIEAKDLPDHIGIHYYKKALYTPGTKLLQPAALVKGLADNLPSNVTLYENTPITSFEKGSKIILQLAGGKITTDNLILTNNCFATHFGFLKNRILPIFTYAGLTRQLTNEEQERLGGKDYWGIIPAHPSGTTLRRTIDNRILIRNTLTFNADALSHPSYLAKAKANINKAFMNRFPMLKNVNFEYYWGGAMGITRNQKSFFGALDKNIFATAGCNGLGLTKCTGMGTLLADWIAGEKSELIDFLVSSDGPSSNPPQPFLGLGVKLNLWWGQHKAGLES